MSVLYVTYSPDKTSGAIQRAQPSSAEARIPAVSRMIWRCPKLATIGSPAACTMIVGYMGGIELLVDVLGLDDPINVPSGGLHELHRFHGDIPILQKCL